MEALGLLFLLKELAPYLTSQFVIIDLDNISLVHMIIGENTKSEQVLPIIVECLALIVAYDIKPRVNHISTNDMHFADPLSRFDSPNQSKNHYKKEFANVKKEFVSNQTSWVPRNPSSPTNPKALSIATLWSELYGTPLYTAKLTRPVKMRHVRPNAQSLHT